MIFTIGFPVKKKICFSRRNADRPALTRMGRSGSMRERSGGPGPAAQVKRRQDRKENRRLKPAGLRHIPHKTVESSLASAAGATQRLTTFQPLRVKNYSPAEVYTQSLGAIPEPFQGIDKYKTARYNREVTQEIYCAKQK